VMLLTYMLMLQEMVLWTVRSFTDIQRRMINVDRCLKMLDVPQERVVGKKKAVKEALMKGEWPDKGEVTFLDVNLRYRPNTEAVLRELTF
jgi:ATP-binding cassette, subfamily C (CFTR/MRP), member 1